MGYTQFYEEVKQEPKKISWKDIFSEFLKKHTKEDRQYAMLAGTVADTATEEDMLVKWRKPWLFWRLFIGGVVSILALYIIEFIIIILSGGVSYWFVFNILFEFVPPIIFPFVLMVFFWELNIPRNISFFQLCVYFVVGGVMSLFFTVLLKSIIQTEYAVFAPVTEEPAKLAAVIVCIIIFVKGKNTKLYGLTGLVIGAAIGSGFSAFESAQYAYTSGVLDSFDVETLQVGMENYKTILNVQIVRMIGTLTGHTLFCAPYAAAIALHSNDSKISARSFLNRDFFITFIISFLMHAFNNFPLFYAFMNENIAFILTKIVMIAALWTSTLFITRKCLNQVVSVGTYVPGSMDRVEREVKSSQTVSQIMVQCIEGTNKGQVWRSDTGGDTLLIGRNPECGLQFLKTPGVSRRHCVISRTPQGWGIQDLNSSYGTYLGSGGKIQPGEAVPLSSEEYVYLGGKKNVLKVTFL